MANDFPDWLTKDFIEKCLEHEEEFSAIKIDSFKVSAVVPPGNNFGSNIYRVTLKIITNDKDEDTSLSLIIKAPLTVGTIGEVMCETSKDSEALFYESFLPQINKLIKHSFAPKSFKSPLPSIVILEDLSRDKFSMADRLKQLDFEHCKLYMNAAAAFHAVSFALSKENPELISSVGSQKMFDDNHKAAKLIIDVNKYALQALANKTKSKEQAEIINRCSTGLWNLLVDSHQPNSAFNCLTQGDPWTTNMMFKYDEDGCVCDIRLLDFQNISYSSPAHDIVFFLWSSANHEVKKHRMSDLYHIYLDAFNENLKYFNCTETLSYDQFMVDIEKMNSVVMWVVGWTPCMLAPTPADMEGVFSAVNQEEDTLTENPFDQYYTDIFCETHVVQILDQLEDHGVFRGLDKQLNSNH